MDSYNKFRRSLFPHLTGAETGTQTNSVTYPGPLSSKWQNKAGTQVATSITTLFRAQSRLGMFSKVLGGSVTYSNLYVGLY